MPERLGEALLDLKTSDKGFNAGLRQAQKSADGLGTVLDATSGRADHMGERLMAAGSAARLMGNNVRYAAMQQRLLMFQLNDVFVSLASGMNPMMVFIQQGSQIGQIYGPEEGGAARALKETGRMALSAATRFPLLTAAVGLTAAAFAGLTYEINQTSDVTVGFSDVALATWEVIADGLTSILKPVVDAVAPWFQTAWDMVVAGTKAAFNFIIGIAVGTLNALMVSWNKLPAVLGDLGYRAGFLMADNIRYWVNEAILLVDRFIKSINAKFGTSIGRLGVLAPLRPNNPFAGAADETIAAFSRALSRDYAGELFDAVQQRAVANALDDVADAADKAGPAMKAAAEQARDPWEGLREVTDEAAESAREYRREIVGGVLTDLRSALEDGKITWAELADVAINALDRIIDKIQDDLVDALSNLDFGSGRSAGFGGGGGGFFSLIGNLFGFGGGPSTGFASGILSGEYVGMFGGGGLIPAGTFGIVGERGPEPVIGTSRGAMVLPNSALRNLEGGGYVDNRTFNIDARGAQQGVAEQIAEALAAYDATLPDKVQRKIEAVRDQPRRVTGGWS